MHCNEILRYIESSQIFVAKLRIRFQSRFWHMQQQQNAKPFYHVRHDELTSRKIFTNYDVCPVGLNNFYRRAQDIWKGANLKQTFHHKYQLFHDLYLYSKTFPSLPGSEGGADFMTRQMRDQHLHANVCAMFVDIICAFVGRAFVSAHLSILR